MRICSVLGTCISAPKSGGDLSALTLMKRLSDKNHKIFVFQVSKKPPSHKYANINIHNWDPPEFLKKRYLPYEMRNLLTEVLAKQKVKKLLLKLDPELVIFQNLFFSLNVPTVVFIRAHELGLTSAYPRHKKIYNEPFALIRRYKLKKATLLITNSNFMASVLRCYGLVAEVVYPFINLESYRIRGKKSGKYILFVKPTKLKGVDIALAVAETMKESSYL